jgi:hypothetical protein
MTIARSHGKARPELPRSRDLPAIASARDRTEGRLPSGRFAPGNRQSVRSGEKHAVKKLLGDASDRDVSLVAHDAMRLHNGAIRDLPSDGPIVRSLAALYGRHAAVAGYANRQADGAGLDSEAGRMWLDVALRHGVRAERLVVTMIDVATRLANASPPAIDLTAARRRLLDAPQADDEPAPAEPAPPADVAPSEADDTWIDAPAVEPETPAYVAPEPSPMVREPMTREQVDAGLMARVLAPAKTGGHLCVHRLNPAYCLDCFRTTQSQAPHCKPWRELLPPGHPQRRVPR